ncbi:tRNA pseudouridine synthase A [Thraustotheca clavata]|uniref:tRNA pseudouridine synthase n=1 Tax=Thraustotheca clavata TaxID=74557 RepID=A0A1V9Z086_9STRA|nr:tRNA pseudouridine synthase A [Thraustotheca clavata]
MANMNDRRIKMLMKVSYYGTGFVGWQRQSAASTGGKLMMSVQDVIENAITSIFRPNERINVTSVSRTDSGTHALQQYCTFKLDQGVDESTQELLGKINAVLPESVLAQSLVILNPEMAKWRTKSKLKKYVYYIQQGKRPIHDISPYTWYLSKQLNLVKLREALNLIKGTHDFRTFSQGLQKDVFVDLNTKRTIIDCKVIPRRCVDFTLNLDTAGTGIDLDKDPEDLSENYVVCIEITGNGFLRHMVRRIIGTLRSVGEGRCEPELMTQVLVGNAEPGPSVPARGLWLHRSWMTRQEYDDEMKI